MRLVCLLLPRAQLERADGNKGWVAGEAFIVGVEDRDELGQLRFVLRGDAESAVANVISSMAVRGKGVGRMRMSYIIARRTSPMGITPSRSPSMGSENRLKASLISASS